jgi:hypothetical protein
MITAPSRDLEQHAPSLCDREQTPSLHGVEVTPTSPSLRDREQIPTAPSTKDNRLVTAFYLFITYVMVKT